MNKLLMKKKIYNQLNAKKILIVIKNYPNTDYALDAEFKLDLINDILHQKKCI